MWWSPRRFSAIAVVELYSGTRVRCRHCVASLAVLAAINVTTEQSGCDSHLERVTMFVAKFAAVLRCNVCFFHGVQCTDFMLCSQNTTSALNYSVCIIY